MAPTCAVRIEVRNDLIQFRARLGVIGVIAPLCDDSDPDATFGREVAYCCTRSASAGVLFSVAHIEAITQVGFSNGQQQCHGSFGFIQHRTFRSGRTGVCAQNSRMASV